MPADLNVAVLRGTLSRPPVRRLLPSGDQLVAYEVTTRVDDSTITVPVSASAPNAPVDLVAGDEVVVAGVVRRRFFSAGGATQSRTEVLANAVVPTRHAARARKAVARAVEVLTAGEE
jgi:single-strand DNA-binding protein